MPLPTISSTTSYLGFQRNEPFAFQPSATNTPLLWAIDTPPPGVTIDTPTALAATGVASTDVITATGHTFIAGTRVFFSALTGGTGLAINTVYFALAISGATFQLAATLGGPAINFTTDISAGTISKVSSGLITAPTGIATQGTYVFLVAATNGDGTGTREFVLGIASSSASASPGSADTSIDLTVDVVTRQVSLGRPGESGASSGALAYLKEGDVAMFVIRFAKGGVQIDPELTGLRIAVKQNEPEAILIEASDFEKVGTGSTACWNLPVAVTGSALAGALADVEADAGTSFPALTEIEWTREVTHNAAPLELIGTTRTFVLHIDRDLAD